MNYISDYSSAYGPGQDSGYYLVLHAEVPNEDDVTITAEVVGGDNGPTTLDESGIIIFRIKNQQQKVKFVASATGEETVTKVYTLNGITFGPEVETNLSDSPEI